MTNTNTSKINYYINENGKPKKVAQAEYIFWLHRSGGPDIDTKLLVDDNKTWRIITSFDGEKTDNSFSLPYFLIAAEFDVPFTKILRRDCINYIIDEFNSLEELVVFRNEIVKELLLKKFKIIFDSETGKTKLDS